MRPLATVAATFSLTARAISSSPKAAVPPGVSIQAGETTLTRIPRPLSSLDHVRANDRTAAFDAAYAPNASMPRSAAVEPVRTTEAPALSSGSAFCTVNSMPQALTPKVWSKCSSVVCAKVANSPIAAFATSTSRPFPRVRTAW